MPQEAAVVEIPKEEEGLITNDNDDDDFDFSSFSFFPLFLLYGHTLIVKIIELLFVVISKGPLKCLLC